ncbi:MAG: 1-deoxy-D-xylulose-5-phosphate synthase [Opitutales bacterium]
MSLLAQINGPADVQALSTEQLPLLAAEIRDRILDSTSVNGGHVGPNLGVVELTLALHRHFTTPKDRFVFDVAHQGYVHKLLTGRNTDEFDHIRKGGGLSGFLTRTESEHDCYGAGHAGTALSAALGMAAGRDLLQTDEHVVAVIGDAALTCGITLEALNNIAGTTRKFIVILNDNKWSIAPNVGAISSYLNELITNPVYERLHNDVEGFLKNVPGGETLRKLGSKFKQDTKEWFSGQQSSLFEKLGLRYIGPIDGNDLRLLDQYLGFCKNAEEPIILHVLTEKGRGFPAALDNPEKFHGTSPFDRQTGKSKKKSSSGPPAYQDVFGKALVEFCQQDSRVVGITGAMPSGTGLTHLREACPKQYFDVGIAEEHAVLFAAGLATQGMKPVCAIYSTFLQRAFDCVVHDVALQKLDVLFCMDRAGLSPNDGPTHHGLFDIAYLRGIPETILMSPKDEDELVDMMHTGLQVGGPAFIRYPRGAAEGTPLKDAPELLEIGKAEVLREGEDIMIWAYGPMVTLALKLASQMSATHGLSIGVTNARFAKPLDEELLGEHAGDVSLIVTIEDHARMGGFGAAVGEFLLDAGLPTPLERLGWPDRFIDHGSSVEDLRAANGLSNADIERTILRRYSRVREAATMAKVSS